MEGKNTCASNLSMWFRGFHCQWMRTMFLLRSWSWNWKYTLSKVCSNIWMGTGFLWIIMKTFVVQRFVANWMNLEWGLVFLVCWNHCSSKGLLPMNELRWGLVFLFVVENIWDAIWWTPVFTPRAKCVATWPNKVDILIHGEGKLECGFTKLFLESTFKKKGLFAELFL